MAQRDHSAAHSVAVGMQDGDGFWIHLDKVCEGNRCPKQTRLSRPVSFPLQRIAFSGGWILLAFGLTVALAEAKFSGFSYIAKAKGQKL